MTAQQELIQKLKLELGKDVNENASFLVTQPFFKEQTLGLKKDELVRGIYVSLLNRTNAPMFEGNVYYFKVTDPEQFCSTLYDSRWEKYMFPLSKIGDWSTEIIISKKTHLAAQVFSAGGIAPKIEQQTVEHYEKQIVEKMQAQDEREALKELAKIEEFPIQKIHMQTMYKSEKSKTSLIITNSSIEGRVQLLISDEENVEDIDDYFKFSFTKEQFSDLVDLMIEARKDLLK